MAELLDSGNRTEFASGAVRDIQEGKGLPHLVPLDLFCEHTLMYGLFTDAIRVFTENGSADVLSDAFMYLIEELYSGSYATAFLEVAKHFEDGAKKYGDNNWRKGIPADRYVDSMLRHYFKWKRGDVDEPHNRACLWNVICCYWTITHYPELNTFKKSEENEK